MGSNSERVAHRAELIAVLEEAFSNITRQELLTRLNDAGVPSGRVRNLQEVYEWEQTRSQGLLVEVEHPTLGRVELPGPPLRFFAADGTETTRTEHTSPPLLDQHGEKVNAWLAQG